MLEIKSLQKKFGDNIVLDIPSFKLNEGIYWIKGINGSGKTTLLKILSGIIPFKGDVVINNVSQKNKPVDYRKFISYAEAEPLYPGFLNGQEILDLYTSVKKEKQETINELLELLQVHYYIKTATGTYSSGMLKKLSLILAFVAKPKVILLDEPLVTLDAASIPRVYQLIKKYHEKFGTTFLLTSHQDFIDTDSFINNKLLVENKTIQFI